MGVKVYLVWVTTFGKDIENIVLGETVIQKKGVELEYSCGVDAMNYN